MIVPDVNVLIFAYDTTSAHHPRARRWWQETLNGSVPVGIPWVVTLGFVRIATHRSILESPVSLQAASQEVRGWFTLPHVQVLEPTDEHLSVFLELLAAAGVAGNLTTDAHIAAIGIEYHAEIATTDNDFGRFPGVRWFNPLA